MAKYFRLKMKGTRRPQDVESEIGEMGAMILRIHAEKDETTVYYALAEPAGKAAKGKKELKGAKEVSLDEVTKMR